MEGVGRSMRERINDKWKEQEREDK